MKLKWTFVLQKKMTNGMIRQKDQKQGGQLPENYF